MKKCLLLIVLLCFLMTNGDAQIPTDGLVAFYALDANAEDSSANSNDGIIQGTVMGEEDRFGNANSALLFDGNFSYIDVPNTPIFNITQEITISVWIKPYFINSGGFTALVNKWEDIPGAYSGMGYYLGLNSDGFALRWNTGSVFADGDAVPLNEWTHVVATYDADSLKIFRNCNLELAIPAIDSIQPTSVSFRIGQQSQIFSASSFNYDGVMDEVLVYNKALELHEIGQLCSNLPTSVNELTKEFEIDVYPNPFRDYLEFASENNQFVKGEVLNSAGKTLIEFNDISSSHLIATNNLQSGFYILRLYTASGEWIARKIVKH